MPEMAWNEKELERLYRMTFPPDSPVLKHLLEVVCQVYDVTFPETGELRMAFDAGRSFVGMQILAQIGEIPMSQRIKTIRGEISYVGPSSSGSSSGSGGSSSSGSSRSTWWSRLWGWRRG